MSSFEFTWANSNNNNSAKVFARKRNSPKDAANLKTSNVVKRKPLFGQLKDKQQTISDVQKESSNTKITDSLKQNPSSVLFNEKTQPTETSIGYVKRKQKKDKLIAKAAAEVEATKAAPKDFTQAHSLFSVKHKNIYVNDNVRGKSVVEKVFSGEKKFSDLVVHRHLVSNLEKHSFTKLTTVQEKAIPEIMTGRNVLIRSQTGSGKTLAYTVPIVDALQNITPHLRRQDGVQALIVVPTRELALQVHELLSKINTFQWIVVGHLSGGENRKTEKDRLRKGVHVLVSTPGRLLDHILHTNAFKIDNVRCLVLDEADRLLDMGFKKDLIKIVEELDRAKLNGEYDPMALLKREPQNVKEEIEESSDVEFPLRNPQSKHRQTVLLSATLTHGIAELADFIMKEHVYVDTLDGSLFKNPKHMVIPETVAQEFIVTHAKHRLFTLSAVLLSKSKRKVFVFMATSQMVDYHYELFAKCLMKMPRNRGKLKVGDVAILENVDLDVSDDEEEIVMDTELFKLHGSMEQTARKEVFGAFRAAKRGILLCTDVAARGVDVPEADCIVQYTGPQSDDDYLHRVGRTGRAGRSGSALIFLTHEEQDYVSRLQEHKVFLKEHAADDFLKQLCVVMEEPEQEKAATALQRRYELALGKDEALHRAACFAYSSWSRFYNTYPGSMRSIFNFKNVNLGHYVTSFALKETPTEVAKVVRGRVATVRPRRLNQKLATHRDSEDVKTPKRMIKSVSLTTSEYGSGLEPSRKKKKK